MAGMTTSSILEPGYGSQRPQQPLNLGGIPGSYGLYNTAIEQNAGDYGSIMKQYQGLSNGPAMQNLASLANTGGYSDQDKQDLRARGISPIRSIYASANRGIDTQRRLQGGYSPNYTAAKAKMARELSNTISDKTIDVNAGIAQNVASNRVGLAGTYANAALQPVQGQQSLYGTTPALASTYGNQALGAAQLQNQIFQGNGSTGNQPYRRPANSGGVRV